MSTVILDEQGLSRLHRRPRNEEAAALIGICPTRYFKLGDTKQSSVVYDEGDVLAWLARRRFRSTSAFSQTVVAQDD